MELSPLARERLEKIGNLSPEESERMSQSRELENMLSLFFKGDLSSEDLWKELKALQEQRGESIVEDAQRKIADTLRLQMAQDDFEQRRSAILALETVKKEGKYPLLEPILNSIATLRQQYKQQKEMAYDQLKAAMQRQLQAMAQEAVKQGVKLDMDSSLEANIKSSQQWKNFIYEHDKTSEEAFSDYVSRLIEIIQAS
jgi:murein L,D-transpeptidase YcbB/YkuD